MAGNQSEEGGVHSVKGGRMAEDILGRIAHSLGEAQRYGVARPQYLLIGPVAMQQLKKESEKLSEWLVKNELARKDEVKKPATIYGLEIVVVPWMEGLLVSQWKYPVRKMMTDLPATDKPNE